MTRPGDDGGPPPVDDFASSVLDVVDSIPPGRVMSYGDIAEYLGSGPGPRQVGRVMAVYGGAVAWWRVIHSDGRLVPGHERVQARRLRAEGVVVRDRRVGSATRGDERSATRRTLPEGSGPSRKDRP